MLLYSKKKESYNVEDCISIIDIILDSNLYTITKKPHLCKFIYADYIKIDYKEKQKEFELYSDSRFLKVMPRYIFAIFANLKGNERLKFKVT